MRLVLCGMSAVLLSGCSWLGFGGNGHSAGQYGQSQYGQNSYGMQATHGQFAGRSAHSPCQITSPTQPIPQGCRPEQVTLAVGGGATDVASQSQYATGGYGSHAGNVKTSSYAPAEKLKKPKLRGTMGLEIDHSVGGTLFSPTLNGALAAYDSSVYYPADGVRYGTPPSGRVDTFNNFSSVREGVSAQRVSFDDAYNAPLRITGGLEYIFDKRNTVFANVGYTHAEGGEAGSADVVETLRSDITTTFFDADQDITSQFTSTGEERYGVTVAKFNYDVSDLKKLDVEVGGRHYFNSISPENYARSITPFVSASVGAAHYANVTVVERQQQRRLRTAFLGIDDPQGNYFNVATGTGGTTKLYGPQWVPYGSVKGGLEWQMTPKTALAFEAGLKVEGTREFADGQKGTSIVSVPIAVRGSYNF